MIWRWIITILIGVIAGLWEVAVIPFVPAAFSVLPLLPLSVLLLVSSTRTRALICLMSGAALLDAYHWSHVDVAMIRLALVLLVLDVAANRFLTNRSVYASVALVLVGRAMDWMTAWLFSVIGLWIDPTRYPWHLPTGWPWILLWDAGIVSIGFLLIAAFTGRFVALGLRGRSF